jgi:hypothetical protein
MEWWIMEDSGIQLKADLVCKEDNCAGKHTNQRGLPGMSGRTQAYPSSLSLRSVGLVA